MTDQLRVRVHQWASGLDPDANRARLAAVEPGADLVVLPEAFARDFGEAGSDVSAFAEPVDGPFAHDIPTGADNLVLKARDALRVCLPSPLRGGSDGDAGPLSVLPVWVTPAVSAAAQALVAGTPLATLNPRDFRGKITVMLQSRDQDGAPEGRFFSKNDMSAVPWG